MGNKVFKLRGSSSSSASSSASTTALASSSSSSSLTPRSPKSKKRSSKEKRAEASKTSSSSSESATATTTSSVSEPPRGPSSPSTASSTSSVSREATTAVEPSFSLKKIEELFYKYVPEEEKDCDDPLMQPEGVEQFLRDIGLDPEDVAVIVLSWHFKASTMCYYKKSEFTRGMVELQVDNVEKLREKIPTLRTELQDRSKFKEIFEFTFSWSREQDKKFLDVETAVGMLELLLPDQLPLSSPLLSFLKVQTSYPVINKDQWISTLEFVEATDDSLSNYNESESWPVIFDEFVKWVKEKNPEKYSAVAAESDF